MSKTASARVAKYDHQHPRPLPETMPLREGLTAIDAAFPTASGHLHDGGAYLDYYGGQCSLVPREWSERANSLFFKGGRLADLGIKVKDGFDAAQVKANVQWLLGSWAPKHEEKAATVGFALMCWCEPIASDEPA